MYSLWTDDHNLWDLYGEKEQEEDETTHEASSARVCTELFLLVLCHCLSVRRHQLMMNELRQRLPYLIVTQRQQRSRCVTFVLPPKREYSAITTPLLNIWWHRMPRNSSSQILMESRREIKMIMMSAEGQRRGFFFVPLFENAVKIRRRRWHFIRYEANTHSHMCQRRRKLFVSVVGQRYLVSISVSGTTAIGKYLVNIQKCRTESTKTIENLVKWSNAWWRSHAF